ncbi:DUF2634 domain-containing protein [Paenibacillus melissococcoides]|uniref:DUF2634 domain-containing protein n=1 Tax=Paenibacillus melissococcoides TaxID=2912268 RepID=UPI0021C3591E|nr:DUF2634 domain-containing protein [Paenibacillus melissococcoides]CAH8721366.1 DUF2634 domain-containing protein [Paenibacillus melissococcoides]CAH8721960.1 DUF2634 domain-containing protein [Paenibacillus melissococcoides]
MAGLHDSDIRLDANWQPAAAANGEALLVTDYDCLFQDIRLEALTQEGELFYDESWGGHCWSLSSRRMMSSRGWKSSTRVKEKLERRIEIDADTIQVITAFRGDAITVHASFRFRGDERLYELDVDLDRVKVEVVLVD